MPKFADAPPPALASALSTADDIADAFELLAGPTLCFGREHQTRTRHAAVDPVRRDRCAEIARAQLARLDPPVLLAGIAVWVNRHFPNSTGTAARFRNDRAIGNAS